MNTASLSISYIHRSSARSIVSFGFPIVCVLFSQMTQAVNPPPDGGYPNYNTAEGQNALFNTDTSNPLTGRGNTATGWYALFSNENGNYCTAVGAGALALNRSDDNTAVGALAMMFSDGGVLNTAVGTQALTYNGLGSWNSAVGGFTLFLNRTGVANSAFGYQALYSNDSGSAGLANGNSAFGFNALAFNVDGGSNNAFGTQALEYNVDGYVNNAFGVNALWYNIDGAANVAIGDSALADNVSGSLNTVVGTLAGSDVEGNDNIYIGATSGLPGGGSESQTIRIGDPQAILASYIAGIDGATVDPDTSTPVFVDANGKLGTIVSSERFKDDIRPMDKASEVILELQPVTFHYKKELDPKAIPQFGLVAEDVAKVNPNLVVRDRNGDIKTVRYEAVNAMLLNEFLKEHRKVEQLKKDFESKLAEQQRRIEALTSSLEKVNARLEASKPTSQVVLKDL